MSLPSDSAPLTHPDHGNVDRGESTESLSSLEDDVKAQEQFLQTLVESEGLFSASYQVALSVLLRRPPDGQWIALGTFFRDFGLASHVMFHGFLGSRISSMKVFETCAQYDTTSGRVDLTAD